MNNPEIAIVMIKMVEYSGGNVRDINHFIKVHGFAETIGRAVGLDADSLYTLEVASIVHDIAIPLCRKKYGNANGKHQEEEGPELVHAFLTPLGCSVKVVERVAYLVGHHHSPDKIVGIDYQILLEADYLVNAFEGNFTHENISNTLETMFKTTPGKNLLRSIYLLQAI